MKATEQFLCVVVLAHRRSFYKLNLIFSPVCNLAALTSKGLNCFSSFSINIASPNVLGTLTKFPGGLKTKLGSPVARNKTSTGETKGKLLTSEHVSEHANQSAQQSIGSIISGKTQVREGGKDGHPVVVLKGNKLREASSKKVHEALKNSDSNAFADPKLVNAVDQQSASCNDKLQVRTNKTHHVLCDAARMTTNTVPTAKTVPNSELQEIADLLDDPASSCRHSHDNRQQTHEGKNELNNSVNAALCNGTKSTLQSNVAAHDKGMGNSSLVLPVSFDNLTSQQPNKVTTEKILPESELQKIAELLYLNDNRQQTHEGKNELNNSLNATLSNGTKGILQSNVVAHGKGMGNSSLILPVTFDNLTSQQANRITTEQIVPDSELQNIAELFDDAASSRKNLHDNRQQTHEGKNELNNSINAALGNETKSTLQSSVVTHDKGSGNSSLIFPVSFDNLTSQQANSITTEKTVPDSELQNIAQLFDDAASSREHLHDNRQQMHESKNRLKNSVNAGLGNERKSALKRNDAHKGMGNSSLVFPVTFHNLTSQLANRIKAEEIVPDSNLQEITELFDDEASTRRPLHDNRQKMHEGKNRLNNSVNANLGNGTKNALQSMVSHNKVKGNLNLIVPINSSDDVASQQTFQRVTTLGIQDHYNGSDMHEQPHTSAMHLTSTTNNTVKHNDSHGMHKHLFTAAAGNKHQNSNDSLLQVSVCITG